MNSESNSAGSARLQVESPIEPAIADSFEEAHEAAVPEPPDPSNPHVDDRRARKNAVLLAVSHTLYSCAVIGLITASGLVGMMLAPSLGLATLPVSTFVIGTALSTIPASLLMRRIGRRPGFMIGALVGLASAVLCTYAILAFDFTLFVLGTALCGVYQAFAQYYRFAAADTASVSFRPKAISYVLVGGLAGAVIGPIIVIYSKEALGPFLFAGTFAASGVLCIVALGVLAFIDIPREKLHEHGKSDARPLSVILAQPRLVAAIVAGMMSYGMMNLVMTATPIAMVTCGLTIDDAAWVIQWHALAMFAPSFITGTLIQRWGVERVLAIGMGLLALAGAAGLAGIDFAHFAVGLILLGLGWNFGFLGATTLVTECYRSSEKNKVQAVNDFAIFATVAVASLSSGKLLDAIGWSAVNWALFPMVGMGFLALAWLALTARRERQAVV